LVEDRGILRHADDDKTSAIVAHNLAAIAVAERDGPERGLAEIRATVDQERLDGYQFYAAAIGELELRSGSTNWQDSISSAPRLRRAIEWSAAS